MIKNPKFKGGKWKKPMIPNPNYKGKWKPKQILNPDTFYDGKPLENIAPIIGIAIEVWTTVGGIHLDNIIITRNLKDAFDYAKSTFILKSNAEKAAEKALIDLNKQQARDKKLLSGKWKDKLEVYLSDFSDYISSIESPFYIAFSVGITLLIIIFSTYFLFGWGTEITNPNNDKLDNND